MSELRATRRGALRIPEQRSPTMLVTVMPPETVQRLRAAMDAMVEEIDKLRATLGGVERELHATRDALEKIYGGSG